MEGQETFRKAFKNLHASPDVLTEVLAMTKEGKSISKKNFFIPRAAVAAIAIILVIGSGSVAFAMDLGGIQRVVQVWFHGEQTDAILDLENGTYELVTENEDGSTEQIGGGGYAWSVDGTERPLTEEELIEDINMPDVSREDDGKIYVYYMNNKMDITDKFSENGVCFVLLKNDGESLYMTVKINDYNGDETMSIATSPHGYLQPDEFN